MDFFDVDAMQQELIAGALRSIISSSENDESKSDKLLEHKERDMG